MVRSEVFPHPVDIKEVPICANCRWVVDDNPIDYLCGEPSRVSLVYDHVYGEPRTHYRGCEVYNKYGECKLFSRRPAPIGWLGRLLNRLLPE